MTILLNGVPVHDPPTKAEVRLYERTVDRDHRATVIVGVAVVLAVLILGIVL